jgi:hypothetical protein
MKDKNFRGFKFYALLISLLLWIPKAEAAIPIAEIIRQGIKRVIVAVDLKIQRLQNETIWLQQAQQELENMLSKVKLEEIAAWSDKQKELYADYYEGFWKVKQTISNFQRVREIVETQKSLMIVYQNTWNLLVREGNFSLAELSLIENRFSGILQESLRNLADLGEILKEMTFQLSDGERLEIIHGLDAKVQKNYQDLLRLSMQLESLNQQRKSQKTDQQHIQNLFK